ncbi:MAG: hypothetical protein KF898_04860 [Parachlamydiales bacterium]|nr:hypothetical protein [Verrucomicrobiota bacterium]MBX3718957.1 hypothetical protein [Candidatus Acheromyda pituitae]
MNLSQAKPAPKQLNLNKLGDAGGTQSHWLSDTAKYRFFILFVYTMVEKAKRCKKLIFS